MTFNITNVCLHLQTPNKGKAVNLCNSLPIYNVEKKRGMTTKQLMDAYLNSGSKHIPNIHKKYKFIQGYCDKGWLEM